MGSEVSDEARQIIDTARSPQPPREWFVWPLRRDVVARAIVGWAATGVIGSVLFVPAALVTIPTNFQHSGALAVFTIVLLVVLGLVAFGGLALCVADLLRLARADQYLLVMTPNDFVKQSPGRTLHVPMASVAYVTLTGVKAPPNPDTERAYAQTLMMMRRYGSVMGIPGGYRREMRRPPSLAFLDTRTQSEVIVATDDAFDQLPVLEEVLNLYAGGQSRARSRAR